MRRIFFFLFGLAISGQILKGDVVNLANGDRFIGQVELVNEKEVHVKNEVAGVLKVPREKVISIFFGTNAPNTIALAPEPASKMLFDPKSIEKVQQDFLATATPEANEMFSDILQGLSTGRLSIEDIRKQAADSLKELRELQSEIGEEADNPLLSGYVGILEKFVKAGPTNRPPATSAVKPAPRPVTPPDDE